jgi:excisionase family DNA binding protein
LELGGPSVDPDLARGAVVSTVEEVVEHPMTPEDVAVLLRIDRETVYRMAPRGELPAFKVSSRWRFLPSRLQRWMEDQEGQPR